MNSEGIEEEKQIYSQKYSRNFSMEFQILEFD